MTELAITRDIFLHWFSHEHERKFVQSKGEVYSDGASTLAVEVRPLLDAGDAAWQDRREILESAIADGLPSRVALWMPAGATLPGGEPSTSEFVDAVRQAAIRLGPGERSYVPLPIELRLRRTGDAGNVVSVSGGLNPHWARFTDRVRGTFDLDSTELHRLPESTEHVEELIDAIVAASESLAPRQVATISTVDAWTIQRLEGEAGVDIVGVSREAAADSGLAVRRNFRRILHECAPGLRAAPADARALVVLGFYPRMEQEGATTAMRGYDPMLYRGIDLICLVADGLVQPIIDSWA